MIEIKQEVTIRVCQSLYSPQAVLAAAYRYTAEYFVSLDEEDQEWVLTIRATNGSAPSFPEALALQLQTDLLDHQLRRDLEEQFRPLREIIVTKALGKGA